MDVNDGMFGAYGLTHDGIVDGRFHLRRHQ
jgi:hypothetical protein